MVMIINFHKISLRDRGLLKEYLQTDHHSNCIFSFGNTLFWDPSHRMEYTIIDDILLFRTVYGHEIRYCTPDFKEKWECILEEIEEDAGRIGKRYRVSSLKREDVDAIMQWGASKYNLECRRDQCDYIYAVLDLVEMNGCKYVKKRNMINRFKKDNIWEYSALKPNHIELCRSFENKWLEDHLSANMHDTEYMQTLVMEKRAIDYALDHYEALDLSGGLITVNGACVAFTIGEKLNNSTFVQHFEKADRSIKGAYEMILREFSKETLLGSYSYLNREEDMGIDNIRASKLSYRPVCIYNKYTLRRKGFV